MCVPSPSVLAGTFSIYSGQMVLLCYPVAEKTADRECMGTQKGIIMKKALLGSLVALLFASVAVADGVVTETETVTTWENVSYEMVAPAVDNVKTTCGRFASSADVKPCRKPCNKCNRCAKCARIAQPAPQPVRVKTHTEVIDHYQVFQPVTVYQPMGVQVERRVVPVGSCNRCK